MSENWTVYSNNVNKTPPYHEDLRRPNSVEAPIMVILYWFHKSLSNRENTRLIKILSLVYKYSWQIQINYRQLNLTLITTDIDTTFKLVLLVPLYTDSKHISPTNSVRGVQSTRWRGGPWLGSAVVIRAACW